MHSTIANYVQWHHTVSQWQLVVC